MASQAASQSKYMQAMNRRQANALIRMGGTDTSALKNFGHMKKPNRTRTSDFQGPPKAWPAQARKQWADRLQQMSVVKQKDRIKFWNIVPGDYVRVKRGNVASQLGLDPNVHKVKPEGVVVRIDRMKNVAYLKVEADSPEKEAAAPRLAPLKKTAGAAAQIDYLTGYTSGYTDKVIEVPAPVAYSDLQLRVGDKEKHEYAHRMERGGKVWYDGKTETLRWNRYAVIKQADGTNKRVKVDWPKLQPKTEAAEHDTFGGQPGQTTRTDVEAETWLPWEADQAVFLPPKAPWQSPWSIAQTAKTIAAMRAQGAINEPMTPNQIRGLRWQYQGFWAKKNYKPLPVPQPPTPGEVVAHERKALAQWYKKYAVDLDKRNFAPIDYLRFAPHAGPAAGGSWRLSSGPPLQKPFERNLATGELKDLEENGAVSKADLDAMPIELLMAGDLENRRGLAWRMRRYKERKEAEKRKAAEQAKREKELLKDFRAAMAEQKAKERELETGVTREQEIEEREKKGSLPLYVKEREHLRDAVNEYRWKQEMDLHDQVYADIEKEKEKADPTFKEYSEKFDEIVRMHEEKRLAAKEAAKEAASKKAEEKTEETDKAGSTSS